MIITQEYNSLNDIDPEFIASLEELLSHCIPSFQMLKDYEETSNDDTTFSYHLFFGDQKNSPIGFAQLEIVNKDKIKHSYLDRIFKKDIIADKYTKTIQWKIPGCLLEGIIIGPMYLKQASKKVLDIFNQFKTRDDIVSQTLLVAQDLQGLLNIEVSGINDVEKNVISDVLVKNQKDYESFLNHLPQELNLEIKSSWKNIYKSLKLKMAEHACFKDVFSYKSQGANQYKLIKNQQNTKKYKQDTVATVYLTLETQDEIKLLIIYSIGKNGNSFYEIIFDNKEVSTSIIHQLAIIHFFDDEQSHKLHFISERPLETNNFLFELGFTKREQYLLRNEK